MRTMKQSQPIGYMVMEDEKGLDEKVLAVVLGDPHYDEVRCAKCLIVD